MNDRHMRFVGVSTGSSSIMNVFPRWSEALGLDATLIGLDLPLDATREQYREAVTMMRDDSGCQGALVTTHKIALHDAAHDLFDELDDFAAQVGEVSSIAFSSGNDGEPRRIRGSAKDPLTAGLTLEEELPPDFFSQGGEVLCLGAGGAGTAIGWYLAGREDPPVRMTFVDVNQTRLSHLRQVVTMHAPEADVVTAPVSDTDALLSALPPHSLVVNATGMGKDRPGSPLSSSATFPQEAVVWELNYRGSLEFLQQAKAQQETRRLQVIDGWRYFIHGWTQVIAEVFGVTMSPDTVSALAQLAEDVRGPS